MLLIFTRVCTCLCWCVYVHGEARVSIRHPPSLATICLEQGISDPRAWRSAKVAIQQVPGTLLLLPPQSWAYTHAQRTTFVSSIIVVWCAYVNVYTHATVGVHVKDRGQLSRVGFAASFLFYHTKYFRLADWWVSCLFCVCFSPSCGTAGSHMSTTIVDLFPWPLGIELWPSALSSKCLCPHIHLSDCKCLGVMDPNPCHHAYMTRTLQTKPSLQTQVIFF